jgi:subtilisin-like proprotein convertase family protein
MFDFMLCRFSVARAAILGAALTVAVGQAASLPAPPEGLITIQEDGRAKAFRVAPGVLRRQDPKTGRGEIVAAPRQLTTDRLAAAARQSEAASGQIYDIVLEDPEEPGVTRMVSRLVHLETAEALSDESLQALCGGATVTWLAGLPRTHAVLRFASAADALASLDGLRAAGGVTAAEPLLGRVPELQFVPNDPFYGYNIANGGYQWHLRNTGQDGGTAGVDCNVASVWDSRKGNGIRVAVVDSGLETTHPDLAINCDTAADHDFLDDTPDDPMGNGSHGTSTAGIIAARGNNNLGTTGVAMNATLVGLRLIDGIDITDGDIANALNWSNVDISSNSWGYRLTGATNTIPGLRGFGSLPVLGMAIAAASGRNGHGVIFVFSSGNYAARLDDANYMRHQTLLPVISVGAVNDDGEKSAYSNPGACVLVCAPSSDDNHPGTTTTTFVDSGSYYHGFGGTSSACPVVSGVVALMLQAKPALGWRDVQEILIRSARKNHAADTGWANNGAGFHFNHSYGAGLVDAQAAVNLATTWTNLGVQQTRDVAQSGLNVAIPDNSATGITRSFVFSAGSNIRVEQVQVETSITHARRGDIELTLTSPSGMISKLQGPTSDSAPDTNWTFKSVRHWGENSQGTWTLKIADRTAGNTGSLKSATVRLFGTSPTLATAPLFASAGLNLQGNEASVFFAQFVASNNPTSFSINQTVPGLTLEPVSGAWTGTPTQAGVFYRTVTATNSAGSDTLAVTLTILPPKPSITADLYPAMVGTPFSQQLEISGNPTSVTASGLPPILTCNPATGLISGNPTVAGNYTATVSATNAYGTVIANIIIKASPDSTPLTDALDTRGRIWFTEAATPWTTWAGFYASDLSDSARSNALMEFVDRSPIETIVQGPAAVRFYYRSSGHATNSVSTTLNVDDEELDYIHTTTSWQISDSYNLPAGSHRVSLSPRLGQMNPNDKGQSYFWLDQVKFGTPQSFMNEATEYTASWLLTGDALFRLVNISYAGDPDIDEARSEDMEDGGAATAQVALAGPGVLAFHWACSCSEAKGDYFRFSFGRTAGNKITGYLLPQTVNVNIPAGVQIPTWTFRQNGVLGYGGSRFGELLQVAYTPSSSTQNFSKWRVSNFSTAQLALPPYAGGSTSDPDFDGRSNLMEYAVGSAPLKSDPTLSPIAATRHGDQIWVEYWRAINTSDLTVTVQASTDGTSWSDLGPGQSLGVSFIWEQFRLVVPLADASKRMFRLKVTLNP